MSLVSLIGPRRTRRGPIPFSLAVLAMLGAAWLSPSLLARETLSPQRDAHEPAPAELLGPPLRELPDDHAATRDLPHDHAARDVDDQPHPHEGGEGLVLAASAAETVTKASGCGAGQPRRAYEIASIAVDITLNRYLDHDPEGRMYALVDQLDEIRAEEAANRAAREQGGDPAVSVGMQGDAIEPLTLRVQPGECLVVTLRNDLDDEPASFHVHGSSLLVAATGDAATAENPDALAAPGATVTYAWAVPVDEPEATHYAHSHGVEREQTSHGLFGAVIVEPAGSTWTDPLTGEPAETGWQMIVDPPDGPAFREFAIYYHEIGHENYRLLDGADRLVDVVDPITSAYRPGSRALNYRSEPFMNRLRLQEARGEIADESLAYSSYAYGDPATPMLRGYLGEPVKQRVVHGGSETSHVHHVHGGSTRWPRQPDAEAQRFGNGSMKVPALTAPGGSERTDSQSLAPSETFDVVQECDAGGCQGSAGDFMYHCHVGHHYFAGMWSIIRVYNTVQDGERSTDDLPPLVPLDGLALEPAVPTDELVGETIETPSGPVTVTADNLASVIEPQLPPPGVPGDYDASVFDWARDQDRYLSEPETDESWPGYQARAPGDRPPVLVDPATGRLAYPMLRPHLARRPPFAPGHGPAPFLDPQAGPDPPAPGASGPTSLCPSGTETETFAINAIRQPVVYDGESLRDSNGMLFVLRSERDEVIADPDKRHPLTIRANAGQDCVDILLRSELRDDPVTPFSKVGAHIHFVQFDVQASDGVNLGFNYEQTVRPYTEAGTTLSSPASEGEVDLAVADAGRFKPGALIGVGMDKDETFEVARVVASAGATITVAQPLQFAHEAGEHVSTEFVRYRWFPDTQVGTAYFHDHTDVLTTLTHGLFGALVVEPPDAEWVDPVTGEPIDSGVIADVHTGAPVGVDVEGSFREMVLYTMDGTPITHQGRSSGGAFGLRAEPLRRRDGDPAMAFSSLAHGDPATPLLQARLGDPIVLRNTVAAGGELHTLHVDGHQFRVEPWSPTSPRVSTVNIGISERYDLVIPAAGGPQRMPGDYLYHSGRHAKWSEGSWGILRVLDADDAGTIQALPDHGDADDAETEACPDDAPVRRFAVAAVEAALPMLDGQPGRVFVSAEQADAVSSGAAVAEPLVLRVGVGDCVEIDLDNRLPVPVSLHVDQLAYDPTTSGGVAVGTEPDQSVAPGQSRLSTWYASPEVGETVGLMHDFADPFSSIRLGAYGAVVVVPAGSRLKDPADGSDLAGRPSWQAVVDPPDGEPYRDFALFFQDEDLSIGTHLMPYTVDVRGVIGVNYGVQGTGDGPPRLRALTGDPVRLHVLAPWSEQVQVFSLEGHRWPQEPGRDSTPLLSSIRLGGHEALTLRLDGGAGGPAGVPGVYRYGNHRGPFTEAGAWGWFEVEDRPGPGLAALSEGGGSNGPALIVIGAAAGLAGALGLVARRVRSRRSEP